MTRSDSSLRALGLALLSCTLMVTAGCERFRSPDYNLEASRAALAADDSFTAMMQVKKALAKDSHNSAGWLLQVDVALLQSDRATAEDAFAKAKEAKASARELAPRQWQLLYLRGDYAALREALTHAPEGVPDSVRHRYDGLALAGMRKPQEALSAFQQALARDPADIDSIIGTAQAEATVGHSDAAVARLKAAASAHPKEARLPAALGDLLAALGHAKEAEAAYRSAVTLTSAHGDVSTWVRAQAGLATTQLSQGQFQNARDTLNALNKGVPNLVLTKMLKTRVALGQGRLADATSGAQALVAALPQDIQGHMLLANSTFRQGYTQQAETSLDAVLEAHPQYAPARKLLAEIQLVTHRAESAQKTLSPLLSDDSDPEALILAGRIAAAQSDSAGADAFYQRALGSPHITDELRYHIAVIFLKRGERDRAHEVLKSIPTGSELAKKRDLLLALMQQSKGSIDAGDALDEVANRYSSDLTLQRTVAALHASRGDLESARTELNALLKSHPDDLDTLLSLAQVEVSARHYDAAAELLNHAAKVSPHNSTVSLATARLALTRADEPAALTALRAACEEDAKALEPRMLLAQVLVAHVKPPAQDDPALKEARGLLKEALALAPHQLQVVLLAAEVEYVAGHPDNAQGLLAQATTNDPSSASIWGALAKIQVSSKQIGKAYDSLNHALQVRPGFIPAVRAICELYISEGNFTRAREIAQHAREIPGLSANEAAAQRAQALMIEGELLAAEAASAPAEQSRLLKEAATAFEASYAAIPSLDGALALLKVREVAHADKPEAALADYLAKHPQDARARNTLAQFYLSIHQLPRAIALYEAAIANGTVDASQLNNLAWLYYQAKDARALTMAQQALYASGRAPEMLDTVGWILLNNNKLTEAVPYIEEAHRARPNNPDIAFHYALALSRQGRVAEARELLGELLKQGTPFPSRADAQALAASLSSVVFK